MIIFQTMMNAKVFNQSAAYRVSVRIFSTSNRNHRNKSVIYKCDDRPEPVLEEKFREKLSNGYKHPRSLPIVVPSQDFTKSVLNTLDKGDKNGRSVVIYEIIF